MSFRVKFQPLCTVDIHHGFHLNGFNASGEVVEFGDLTEVERNRRLSTFDLYRDLTAHVPNDTQGTLSGLGCILKTTKSGFLVATEVETKNSSRIPIRVPSSSFKIRFTLELRDSSFLNYTNISIAKANKIVFYLSNKAGLLNSKFPELSLPQPTFQSNTMYLAGDVVQHEGDVFLSLRNGNHVAPTNADSWRRLGQRSYLSQADEVLLVPRVFMIQPSILLFAVEKIRCIDQSGSAVDIKLMNFSPGQPMRIDASQCTSGLYNLEIQGKDDTGIPITTTDKIYVDNELARRNTLVVVELFHVPGDALGEYRLYDESTGFALRQPRFLARLLNRYTFWRYRFRTPPLLGDLGDLDADFVTKKAMPLSQEVQQVKLGTDHAVLLPNPHVDSIVPEPDRIYSNVFRF